MHDTLNDTVDDFLIPVLCILLGLLRTGIQIRSGEPWGVDATFAITVLVLGIAGLANELRRRHA
jgi:hypothetical protein